jgi:hypothetical protein
MVQEKELRMETNIGAEVKRAATSLRLFMDTITKDCVARLEAQYDQVLQQLTPYDSEDAKRVFDKQVQLLDTLERTNAALVSENSRLRIHHSFMPIRYREEIERMQQQDNQLYREQRQVPKVISPQDTDNHPGIIKLVEAPRAHEMVRRYLHDCEYAGIEEMRAGIKQSMKLRENLRKHVILKKEEHVNAVPLFGSDDRNKNDAPIYNHLDYVRQAIGRSLLLRSIKEAHQKQPSTNKNISPITIGEIVLPLHAEGQHSSSEDTDIHSTSPRRLSDMSELSDQRGSTTEAAYSSGANDLEPESFRNSDEDDRQYESGSDDSVL